jgi:hypothetical protein
MKHDEALARTMSPAERVILEEWAARDGPLAEACRAALRDLDAATKTDVLDEMEFRVEARELTRLLEGDAENALAKGLWPVEANFAAMTDEQLEGVVQGANREWCARQKHGGAPAGGSSGVECPECGGVGWHYGAEDRDCGDCPACNGSGLRQ